MKGSITMAIQFKFFRLSAKPDKDDESKLNDFLSSHQILYDQPRTTPIAVRLRELNLGRSKKA